MEENKVCILSRAFTCLLAVRKKGLLRAMMNYKMISFITDFTLTI
jgi:hypothetical protein